MIKIAVTIYNKSRVCCNMQYGSSQYFYKNGFTVDHFVYHSLPDMAPYTITIFPNAPAETLYNLNKWVIR